MIHSIEIENFQSHIDTVIDLHPGVNLLIGESDHGKSAILRAIYWCALNLPLGNNFINWGNEKNIASVTIINDIHTVNRSVGKGINSYFLDDFDNELTGFGKSVPQIISEALRLNELNFQRQKDVFFLMNKSAPEVGRYLNTVIDLDVIDRSLTHANKRVKSIEQEIDVAENNIEQKRKDLQRFKNLSEVEEQLIFFEELENQLEAQQIKLTKVIAITEQVEEQQSITNHHKKLLDLESELNGILELNQQINELIHQADELESLINAITEIKKKLKLNKELIKLSNKINKLLELDNLIIQKKNTRNSLENLCDLISHEKDKIDNLNEDIKKYQKLFGVLMPDECPLCGRGA